jgi:MFS family permease
VKRPPTLTTALPPTALGAVIGTYLMMAGEGAINPVLPLFGKALGGDVTVVGAVIAASGASRVLANVPVGRAADIFGRRPLLVYGPLLTLLAALLASGARGVWQLGGLRLLSGVGMAAFMTGSIIMLSDIEDEGVRLRAIGLFRAAVILGLLTGPIVGGAVAELGGYRTAFLLQAAVCAGASSWSYARLPRDGGSEATAVRRTARRPLHQEIRSLLANRDLLLVSFVTFNVFFMLTGARVALLPLLAEARLDISAGGLGLLFGLISLADLLALWPAGRLGRTYGPKPVIVASGGIMALGLLTFAAAHASSMFVLGAVLMGVGTGLASPTTASYAAGAAPRDGRGSAMGLYQTVGDLGFVVGPLLLGSIAGSQGFGAGLWCNAVLAVGVSIAFAAGASSRRPKGHDDHAHDDERRAR